MRKKIISVLLAAMCFGGVVNGQSVKEKYTCLYVSEYGNDASSGEKETPIKTLQGAQNKIRELKKNGQIAENGVVVYVREGTYSMTESMMMTEEDSGTKQQPITYRSYPGEKATFVGGVALEGKKFEKVTDEAVLNRIISEEAKSKIVRINLKNEGITEIPKTPWRGVYSRFHKMMEERIPEEEYPGNNQEMELYANGEAQTNARYPNKEYMKISEVVSQFEETWNEMNIYDAPFTEEKQALYDKYKDIAIEDWTPHIIKVDTERAKKWQTANDAIVTGSFYWDWASQGIPVTDISKDGEITLKYPSLYGTKEGGSVYIYNLLEELDTPGEFYIDREEGYLYYYPASDIKNIDLKLSLLKDPMISMQDTSWVNFKDLDFTVSRGKAFLIKGGSNINITGCELSWMNDNAINVTDTTEFTLKDSYVHNVKYGININSGDKETMTRANCVIENNEFENCDKDEKTYYPAIRMGGCGITARYNKLHESQHCIIMWGGCYMTLEYNEIYNACTNTNDMGAVYAGKTVIDRGSVIKYNYIHDVGLNGMDAHGIYLDDGLCGYYVIGNVVENTSNRGVFIGGGRDNVVFNNMFINCNVSILSDARFAPGNWVEARTLDEFNWKNDLYKEQFPELYYMDESRMGYPEGNVIKNNFAYKSGEMNINPLMNELGTVENNYSTNDDPGFYSLEDKNYQLTENAKAYELLNGFQPIPFTRMGQYKERTFDRISNALVLLPESCYAFANGTKVTIDSENEEVVPKIVNGRTYLPIRFIAEKLGAEVEFSDNIATITKNGEVVQINIAEKTIAKNGNLQEIDGTVMVENGRTLIPVRAVAEMMNQQVFYDENNGVIVVSETENLLDSEKDSEMIRYMHDELTIY